MFFFISLLLGGIGILSYFYYDIINKYNDLKSSKETLETKLEGTQTKLESANSQLSNYEANSSKIKKYNDFIGYLAGLMQDHGLSESYTQAEYDHGLELAEDTEDQEFVDIVQDAWEGVGQDAVVRTGRVIEKATDGIEANL